MKYFYKYKSKFSEEIAVVELFNKHFFKSKVGLIMSVALSLTFMLIYFIFAISNDSYGLFGTNLSIYISLTILPITLIALPLVIVEFKKSIILRKIAVSKITSLKFCLLLLAYYFLVLLLSTIFTILLYTIFLNKHASEYFSLYNWGELIYSILNTFILSLVLGLMLGVICKKTSIAQAIGVGFMFLSLSLSGQLIPMKVIASTTAIKYISLFSPLSYPLGLLNNVAFVNDLGNLNIPGVDVSEFLKLAKGSSIFNIDDFYIFSFDKDDNTISKVIVYYGWQKILNLILPWALSALIMFYNVKKFNWTSR